MGFSSINMTSSIAQAPAFVDVEDGAPLVAQPPHPKQCWGLTRRADQRRPVRCQRPASMGFCTCGSHRKLEGAAKLLKLQQGGEVLCRHGHTMQVDRAGATYCPTCKVAAGRASQVGRVHDGGQVWNELLAFLGDRTSLTIDDVCDSADWDRYRAASQLRTWLAAGRVRRVGKGSYEVVRDAPEGESVSP